MLNSVGPDARTGDDLPLLEVQQGLGTSKDGHGIGDLVDPVTLNGWVSDYLASQSDPGDGALDLAFRFGVRAEGRHAGRSFAEAEAELRSEWASEKNHSPWDAVREAAYAGFDRARDRRV
jgi:hypothetical protein